MQSIKESATNVAASAKAGMEKTKAVVHEKADKMRAHTPAEKQIATERKEERINHAELEKQQTKSAAHMASTTGTGMPTIHHH